MRYLFAILISVVLCAVPISAGAVTASVTLDVHQDVQSANNPLPNDFHIVGHIKSYISAPVLSWHTDGPFTSFSYTITKVDPSNPADPWYDFTADWSLPAGSPGIAYCTIIHLGLQFDVEGANTIVDLKGWWTRDGQPIGQVISGQYNGGFVPAGGFDVTDNANEGLKMRITNGQQQNPPLPPLPGPTPPAMSVQVVQMGAIAFRAGQAPPPEALTETGAQASWSWIPVNNSNGEPISVNNPMYMAPDSFFDVFLEVFRPGQPGLPQGQQMTLDPGGTLVTRTLTQFTNNAGETEQRWQWDVHQAPNDVDWRPGNEYKWLQMPDVTNTGMDIRCDMNDGTPRLIADDFKCIEYGPITDIHFWGSWLNDNKGNIEKIHVAFYSDVPANGTVPSHPDDTNGPIWQQDFLVGQFSEKLYQTLPNGQYEWWWDNYKGTLLPNGDTQVWQYDISTANNPFVQTGSAKNPIIYWMAIQVYVTPQAATPQFGWKTRNWRPTDYGGGHFMDDAAWKEQGTWLMHDYRYPASHPKAPDSIDMSFVLTGNPRQRDWGDAPDSATVPGYPTFSAHGGANHGIIPEFCLGNLIDAEADGQPNMAATGDDLAGLADEDGVTFPGPLTVGQNYTVTVVASAPGVLDAWIDYNANSSWTDAGEQVFANKPLVAGPNVLTFAVPAAAAIGQTYARFRLSSTGGLAPAGWANDGEVEDYIIAIQQPQEAWDWGDAPDDKQLARYPTLSVHNGARHKIVPGFFLGSAMDAESDGQPTAMADGDDINPPAGPDDEDGVTIPSPLLTGRPAVITVVASAAGKLDAWIDYNSNGMWTDAGEQIFASVPLVAGVNSLNIVVPTGASLGESFARFRFSSLGGLTAVGPAYDGEVEDYRVVIEAPPTEYDFGDAPDDVQLLGYPTLLIHNGARHIIQPDMHLGFLIDSEINGQPNATATGDDIANLADEDGVVFKPIYADCWAMVRVYASLPGFLNAWMDFNGDSDWADPGEQIFTNKPLAAGYNYLKYHVPANCTAAPTFARFRYDSDGGLSYTGLAKDGEVEDYQINIRPTPPIVTKAQAKLLPLNSDVLIKSDVVTANFGLNGWYFEEPDRWVMNTLRPGRYAGIGVLADPGDPANGIPPFIESWTASDPVTHLADMVSCVGVTTLTPDGEVMINEAASWLEGPHIPLTPVGQNNRTSGGSAFGHQPGTVDYFGDGPIGAAPRPAIGLNSVALLVRIWGSCTSVITDTLGNVTDAYIDDGSNLWDGTWVSPTEKTRGVKLHFPVVPSIPIVRGKVYTATGIMRTELPSTLTAGAPCFGRCLWVTSIN